MTMNKEKFIEEVSSLGEGVEIETNEDTYTIEEGESFIGGIEDTYMSVALGNIAYDDIESCASALYDFITKELKEKIINISI